MDIPAISRFAVLGMYVLISAKEQLTVVQLQDKVALNFAGVCQSRVCRLSVAAVRGLEYGSVIERKKQ